LVESLNKFGGSDIYFMSGSLLKVGRSCLSNTTKSHYFYDKLKYEYIIGQNKNKIYLF